ncbi:MAG: MFS transporter [Actinomycetota bacterium]|nr:MFS transporter [Actinomycetota bacterium]
MRPSRAQNPSHSTVFAAFAIRNYRLFASTQILSSTGAWMQRVAQDWFVLSVSHSPTAVGVTIAMQFAPTMLFGLYGGVIADRHPRRTLLLVTQTTTVLLAATLATLALTGRLTVLDVDLLAFAFGLVVVVDNPARQAFVGEVVGGALIRNAVSLNATIFQLGGMLGPAIAGLLIGSVGVGWAFAVNAASYLPVVVGLVLIDAGALLPRTPVERASGQLREGLHYIHERPHLLWLIVLVGVVGTLGLNMPVVLTTYSTEVFHVGPVGYGLMSSALAVGSVGGALLSARRVSMRLRWVVLAGGIFGALQALAALAPDPWLYAGLLVGVGAASLTFTTGANTTVQLGSAAAVRGRVMGIYLLVLLGGSPLGGPLVGLITTHLGARFGMLTCGLAPLVAALAVATRLHTPARAG